MFRQEHFGDAVMDLTLASVVILTFPTIYELDQIVRAVLQTTPQAGRNLVRIAPQQRITCAKKPNRIIDINMKVIFGKLSKYIVYVHVMYILRKVCKR